jgi:hypothetical protein
MNKIPPEYEEQKTLVQWLKAKKIFFFAPTNENNSYKQNRQFAMIAEQKAKVAGKLKGVSDLVVFTDKHILFIEMKRRPKRLKNRKLSVAHTKVSKEQIDFLEKVNRFSYTKSRICYGAKEAIEFIEENL